MDVSRYPDLASLPRPSLPHTQTEVSRLQFLIMRCRVLGVHCFLGVAQPVWFGFPTSLGSCYVGLR